MAIQRERDRSDRREIPFSILLIHSKPRSPTATQLAISKLTNRLRLTDEISDLDAKTLGILLTDTESDPACKLAAELQEMLKSDFAELEIEVFTYPFDENFDQPDSNTVSQSAKKKRSKSAAKAEAIRAQALTFSLNMPWWKRTLDLMISITTLVLLSPLLILVAILIKLTSRGPIFFFQWREGKNGQKFKIYKFRTMKVNAESQQDNLRHLSEQDGPAFKIKNDPRLTWFGAFLRKSCLDETPQFFNILKGDMTLVGPRPLPVNESQACTRWQRRRLDVTPGMTCLWQVYGDRNVSFDEWMRMDERYIRTASLKTDLLILFRTALFVLLRRASV